MLISVKSIKSLIKKFLINFIGIYFVICFLVIFFPKIYFICKLSLISNFNILLYLLKIILFILNVITIEFIGFLAFNGIIISKYFFIKL